ncbi:serine aminopeptidase domain-containing protein [Kangiella sp. TOML190]|uniref:serine aminopeptidase domain-containing protein n=1 Tax=Kangiella sp. TOML190 TaxID=2931351 RepID=UPI00203B8CE4|nr:alpha/beta hydrolase [Kangiella sp. TOML190]
MSEPVFPLLILMPGMDGSGLLYQPLGEKLQQLELPFVIEPLNPHQDKWAYIEYLEQKYPAQPLVLVAESYAGHIATLMAIRGNLDIQKIVLMATFLETPTKLTQLEKLLPTSLIQKPPLPNLLLGKALFGKNSSQELLDLFFQAMDDVSSEQLSERIRDMRHLTAPTEQLSIPALYIQASDDWLVPARNYQPFKKVFTHLGFSQLNGSHLIAQTQPRQCAFLIESFVKKA